MTSCRALSQHVNHLMRNEADLLTHLMQLLSCCPAICGIAAIAVSQQTPEGEQDTDAKRSAMTGCVLVNLGASTLATRKCPLADASILPAEECAESPSNWPQCKTVGTHPPTLQQHLIFGPLQSLRERIHLGCHQHEAPAGRPRLSMDSTQGTRQAC